MSDEEALPVAAVKREFRRLLEAAEHGRRTVILRHGRPVAALGPIRPERPDLPVPRKPGGLLSLLGSFADWQAMETDVADVIAMRCSALDRPAPELD
jgi:antitoxin (DNA-binding transcriptional repressor) of toxin-antitoxin stability system